MIPPVLPILGSLATIVSNIKTFITVVGPAVTNTAIKIVELAKTHLPTIVKYVETFAKSMQILSANETIEDMGRKALLSDKKPEDFDTNRDYIDHLRHKVQTNPEKIKTETEINKLTNLALGAAIIIKTINEVKESDVPIKVWVSIAKLGLKQPEAEALLDSFKDSYDALNDYLVGQQNPEQEISTGDKITEVFKEIYPELSNTEIDAKVMRLELFEDKK